MIQKSIYLIFGVVLIFSLAANTVASDGKAGQLRVGAVRVDITPPADALPASYTSILDPIYARVIVLDNGADRAVLIAADVAGFSNQIYEDLAKEIVKVIQCPKENILISGTHTHSSLLFGWGRAPDENLAAHIAQITKDIAGAVHQAKASLQPARVGFGTGQCYVNVNRDAIDPVSRKWYQGPNLDGPSDKTIAVVKFETLSGDPIAVYVNYAMHPVHYFMQNRISPDFPGACSRWIERNYDDKVVALWTNGASGDQNPLYSRLTWVYGESKMKAMTAAGGSENPGVMALSTSESAPPVSQKVLDGIVQVVNSTGTLMGEEVIRVMGEIKETSSSVSIKGMQKLVTCPGRQRTDSGREGMAGTYVDTDPVGAKIGLIKIGPIAIASIGGEPYNMIAQRLKREAPLTHLIVVTLANGQSAGYLPTDDAYDHKTFQVLGTRFKPGCAERAIIDGTLELIEGCLSD